MKVVFVIPRTVRTGGMRVIAAHAGALHRAGHCVVVISDVGPQLPLRQRLGTWVRRMRKPDRFGIDGFFFQEANVPVRQVHGLKAEDVPDADVVIIGHWRVADRVMGLPDSKGIKVHFVQGYLATGPDQRDERERAVLALPIPKIVVSSWLKEMCKLQCPTSKVVNVPNAVDGAMFHAANRAKQMPPSVGWVYSPVYCKGCDLALEAFTRVRKARPDVKAVAFGTGRPVSQVPLPDGALFYHDPEPDQITKIYSRCDAWLFPSREEGYGLPLLEAMACGTPVVATPAGAAPDLVGPDEGVLLESHDPGEMAEGIEHVLRWDLARWRRASEAARARAQQHTWAIASEAFEAALKHLVAGKDASFV